MATLTQKAASAATFFLTGYIGFAVARKFLYPAIMVGLMFAEIGQWVLLAAMGTLVLSTTGILFAYTLYRGGSAYGNIAAILLAAVNGFIVGLAIGSWTTVQQVSG